MDLPLLLGRAPSFEDVHYKNAKVVLVGESGVGKSGLALVLTGQPFAPTESTHGRHVWPLDGQEVTLHEAAVALILFDAARDTDPLAGIRYWQRALHLAQQARGAAALPLTTYLVADLMTAVAQNPHAPEKIPWMGTLATGMACGARLSSRVRIPPHSFRSLFLFLERYFLLTSTLNGTAQPVEDAGARARALALTRC